MLNIPVGASGKQHGIQAPQLSLNTITEINIDLLSKFLTH